jgi:hypothetical protein
MKEPIMELGPNSVVLLVGLILGIAVAIVTCLGIPCERIRSRVSRAIVSVLLGLTVTLAVLIVNVIVSIPKMVAAPSYPRSWRESRDPMVVRIIELHAEPSFAGDPEEGRIDGLIFHNTKITDADIPLFTKIGSLELLDLSETHISDVCGAQF